MAADVEKGQEVLTAITLLTLHLWQIDGYNT